MLFFFSEPEFVYIGQVILDFGPSVDMAQSIIKFFTMKRIAPSELVAVRFDGINVNIGKKNGLKPFLDISCTGL